jgi:hypothetical protein
MVVAKVFVADFDQHDEYRRGRAVDRQDMPTVEGGTGVLTHTVVEGSEEVRAKTPVGVIDAVKSRICLALIGSSKVEFC